MIFPALGQEWITTLAREDIRAPHSYFLFIGASVWNHDLRNCKLKPTLTIIRSINCSRFPPL